jgi:hypothetical protein
VVGGCGDVDCVGSAAEARIDDAEVPAGHFVYLVAAGTRAAAVGVRGRSAVGVADDVVEMPNGRITIRVMTGLVAQFDQLGEAAVELAAGRIAAHYRPRSSG